MLYTPTLVRLPRPIPIHNLLHQPMPHNINIRQLHNRNVFEIGEPRTGVDQAR